MPHDHKPATLPPITDMHRAILSLREEPEAVDWYAQRAEVCEDDALRAVLTHNQNEEVEHAMMLVEWIRRQSPVFDANARRYLYTSAPIVGAEATSHPLASPPSGGSLDIGSLKDDP